jgi:hypothetical protein
MPITVVTASGTVHANSTEEADRVAGWLQSYGPRVRERLDAAAVPPPQVSVVQTGLPGGPDQSGVCYKPNVGQWFIAIQSGQQDAQEFLLVHELVHYYSGREWDRLSPAMQEGLADEIARALVPDEASRGPLLLDMSALFSYTGGDPRRYLDMGRDEYDDLDPVALSNSRGVGYFVAHRLGVDALRELCLEAERNGVSRVSAMALLDRAGLAPTDTRTWYGRSPTE